MPPTDDLSLYRGNLRAMVKAMKTKRVMLLSKARFNRKDFLRKLPKLGALLMVVDDPYHSKDTSTYVDAKILSDPRILAVATEDWIGPPHPKVMLLPIGLESKLMTGRRGKDTRSKFLELVKQRRPSSSRQRNVMCDANRHIFTHPWSGYRPDRMAMVEEVDQSAIDDWYNETIDFTENLEHAANAKLALCPEGNGMDCHRFYHNYALGTRCIVREGKVSQLHAQFPGTIVVKSWSEVVPENIANWVSQKPPEHETKLLTARYWIETALEKAGLAGMNLTTSWTFKRPIGSRS